MSKEKTISEEDFALLQLLKKEVKEKPKGDDVQGLKEWMKEYLATSGEIVTPKEEPQEKDTSKTKTTVTYTKMRDPPKVTNFSGSNSKGEATYAFWRYEVCGLMEDKVHDSDNISYAVRKSLKGEAGTIVMHLGPKASLPEIIHKLDSIYGDVEKKEDLLAQFYRARQGDDECVTKWSCRLEDIIGKAIEKGMVQHKDANTMLHSMLWSGLKTELKDISGHKYDTIKDFDELRIALRHIERDHEERKTSKKPQTAKAAAISEPINNTSEFEEVKGLIQQLTTRFDRMETDYRGRGRGYINYRGQNNNRYTDNRQGRWQDRSKPQASSANQDERRCFRCGKPGHLKLGCIEKLDKDGKPLNFKKSMEQDHR
ncbi:uncharacterized protein LOC143058945 [Mytilus galloprovincialis]|uniref:uncharacterized protein LOC143058945 n=1 Tax=Mytilus galloprovincialis TaxID=29158 RepID=UPI003F7BA494